MLNHHMTRATALVSTGVLGAGLLLVGAPTAALAAPIASATYAAQAGASLVDLDADLLTFDLAGVGVGPSRATTTSAPQVSTATASNLDADVVGLGITPQSSTQSAPPDNATATTAGLNAVDVPLLLDTGLVNTSVQARTSPDAASCVPLGTALSTASVGTAGVTVAPGLLGVLPSVVDVGAIDTTTVTELVDLDGTSRAVQSSAAATVAGIDLLGGVLTVDVDGTPTLTATASGDPATSGAVLTGVGADTVTATLAGVPVALDPTGTTTIPVDLTSTLLGLRSGVLASVELTLGQAAVTADTGLVESATASVLTLDVTVELFTAGIPVEIAQVTLDVAPLAVSATAPADGIQCAPPTAAEAPAITSPASGDLVATTTPTVSGTGTPGATVTVVEGAQVVCTATVDAGGTWSCIPPPTFGEGPHTITATQVLPGGTPSAPSAAVTFTVDTQAPAVPTIRTPANGSTTTSTTTLVSGSGEPGASLVVSEGGATLCTVTVAPDGSWACDPLTFALGEHTLTAVQTDPTGNTSGPASTTFTVLAPAAGAPTITSPVSGELLADGDVTLTGTGTDGALVTVVEDGTPVCTTLVLLGTWTCDATFPDGPHTVTATQLPVDGSPSAASAPVTFTVDTLADAPPTITSPVGGEVVADSSPTVTGTGVDGSLVTVAEGGTVLCTALVSSGTWACVVDPALAEGPHTITATQTDPAGNTSDPSAPVTFTVDTVADAAPVIVEPATGDVTNDATPDVNGTGVDGSVVTVREGGVVLCTTPPVSGASWSCTVAPALAEGPHTITATQTDAAGNVSPAATPVTFVVDLTASAAPVILDPAAGDVLTDTTPDVSGTGVPGETITVLEDGATLCTVVVPMSGAWSCTSVVLALGSHTITATSTDPAGNTSVPSAPVTFSVVTPAEAPPTITDPADGSSVGDATPTIAGTGVDGATVVVTEDGVELCSALVSGGLWSCTSVALDDGPHTVTATQQAPDGAVSEPSAPVTFTVDTVAPAVPLIESPAQGAELVDTTPTTTGTAEPGTTVLVTEDGRALCLAPVSDVGGWSCDAAELTLGAHTLTAVAVDAAGNVSPEATRSFTVVAPAAGAPTITAPLTGTVTNDTSPTITGTGIDGATVSVQEAGAPVCTATVVGTTWTCDASPALAEGPHTVVATQVAPGFSESAASNAVSFTIDTTADAAPAITSPLTGAVLGDPTPTVSGTGVTGSTVTVSENGTVLCTAVVAGGTWTCVVDPALVDGPHTIVATQTDPAGNTSVPSAPVAFVVDTVAPAPPVITSPTGGTVTTDPTPTVTGTGEPGATVVVSVDGNPVCTTTVTPASTFTCTPTTPLTDGPHVITAVQTDPAGNPSGPSAPVSITVDTQAPAAPVITSPADGSAVEAGLVTFTGTGEPGATVVLTENGQELCRAVVDQGSAWTCTTSVALAVGAHTVTATQTDPAGNTSAPDTVTFTLELGGTQYVPSGPTRVLDTRSGGGAPVPAGGTRRLTAAQLGLTPGSASAVALNVTVAGSQADGFLSLYPSGDTRPTVSSLNFQPGQTVANLVIVPVGPDGSVTIYAQRSTHVVADLFGYFSTTQLDPTGGLYHSLQPRRLEDTRFASGSSTVPSTTRALGTNGLATVQATGRGGVPRVGVSAVAVNITVSRPTDSGYVSAFPSNQQFSGTSNLNFVAGDLASTRAIVPVGPDGAITFYNRVGRTDLVVDVTGYFSADGSGDTTGSQFVAVEPQRVADSRDNLGAFDQLGGNSTQNLRLTGVAGIPDAGTTAVVSNVTAVDPSEDGFFTVHPAGTARPLSSDVNFRGSTVVPNLALAGLGAGGQVSLYNLNGTADAVVDVTGYFTTSPPVIGGVR